LFSGILSLTTSPYAAAVMAHLRSATAAILGLHRSRTVQGEALERSRYIRVMMIGKDTGFRAARRTAR
jgi:hypothetical protein